MKHEISRRFDKVCSWFRDFIIDVVAYLIFLLVSVLLAGIVMGLTKDYPNICSEIGLEVPYIESLPMVLVYSTIILVFMALYSKFVESKFDKPSIKVLIITTVFIIIAAYIIGCISNWLISLSGLFQGESLLKLLELLGIFLYILLLSVLMLAICLWSLMIALLFKRLLYPNWPIACFKRASSAVDRLAESYNAEKCLFRWGNIPGEDSERLANYLREDYDVEWVESKDIYKSDDGRIIHISNTKNSLKIMISENKEKATLNINNTRIYDLKVKKENGKLNIYEVNKNMFDIHTVSDNYKNGVDEVKDLLRRGIYLDRNFNLNKVLDQLAFWMQYYLLYGRSEQIESVKKHLDNISKNFDEQYDISLDQFVYEISRMHDKMQGYFKKNEIHPECSTKTRSTELVGRFNDQLLNISLKVLALIIAALTIYLSKLQPSTI